MEEDRDFAGTTKAEIALPMCGSTKSAGHMVVVSYLVVGGGVDPLLAYVALRISVEDEAIEVRHHQTLFVEVEGHRYLLELEHLVEEPVHAVGAHVELELALELHEIAHNLETN